MRFNLCSDVHLDFPSSYLQTILSGRNADTLVIAGDWAEMRSPAWYDSLLKVSTAYKNVVYVLGNHEFYFSEFTDPELPNVHVLRNSTVELEGVTFAGTPLWFDMTPHAYMNSFYLNDFRCIDDAYVRIAQWRSEAVEFLRTTSADVIVTHHAPSSQSLSQRFAGSPANCFYATDTVPLRGKVWCHGHIHEPVCYLQDGVRVVSNPFGYPGERSNPQLITVEV